MIINYITDNDLYKFTMQYAVLKLFPESIVKYKFCNRGGTKFPKGFNKLLSNEIKAMANLSLTKEEALYMQKKCYYLPQAYIDYLTGYRFNPDEITINQNNGDLEIEIEGPWYRTILWEVPIMAIVSELYYKTTNTKTWDKNQILDVLQTKIDTYNKLDVKVADFGTRRRFSFENQDTIVANLIKKGGDMFVGTSNVYLAMKYETTPIGTHAHEWFMFHAAIYGYKVANKTSLEDWVKVYRGNLGIALSDTFTTDVFYKSFDTLYAKLFDGVRHDSGDPLVFADKTINHYKNLKINPLSKTIVFSDALNPQMVEKITEYCKGKIGISYGIGTNFTNDVGVKPLNIVIKMSQAKENINQRYTECIKLSDNKGKHTGCLKEIELAKEQLGIQ